MAVSFGIAGGLHGRASSVRFGVAVGGGALLFKLAGLSTAVEPPSESPDDRGAADDARIDSHCFAAVFHDRPDSGGQRQRVDCGGAEID